MNHFSKHRPLIKTNLKSRFALIIALLFLAFFIMMWIAGTTPNYKRIGSILSVLLGIYILLLVFDKKLQNLPVYQLLANYYFNNRDIIRLSLIASVYGLVLVTCIFFSQEIGLPATGRIIGIVAASLAEILMLIMLYRVFKYGSVGGKFDDSICSGETIHSLKNAIGAMPDDKVIIARNWDVYTVDPDGVKTNHGPYMDYIYCRVKDRS